MKITYHEKCVNCKFFLSYYKNKWRKRKCEISKEELSAKSLACDKFKQK